LRIRVQQSDLMPGMFRALGAEPVLLLYIRLKTGFSTDLIDDVENNWAILGAQTACVASADRGFRRHA
jgi:TRAP-type C4-dicarboxylate transport system substrate-binding protein